MGLGGAAVQVMTLDLRGRALDSGQWTHLGEEISLSWNLYTAQVRPIFHFPRDTHHFAFLSLTCQGNQRPLTPTGRGSSVLEVPLLAASGELSETTCCLTPTPASSVLIVVSPLLVDLHVSPDLSKCWCLFFLSFFLNKCLYTFYLFKPLLNHLTC